MYQSLEIVNATEHIVKGEINCMAFFCINHYFFMKPNSKWQSDKKRIYPIVEVSAEIKTPRGIFIAQPYTSLGTFHGRFEVVELRKNIFKVIRSRNTEADQLKT